MLVVWAFLRSRVSAWNGLCVGPPNQIFPFSSSCQFPYLLHGLNKGDNNDEKDNYFFLRARKGQFFESIIDSVVLPPA
jgi:hypothetical protein